MSLTSKNKVLTYEWYLLQEIAVFCPIKPCVFVPDAQFIQLLALVSLLYVSAGHISQAFALLAL